MATLPKEYQLPIAYIGDAQEFNRIWHTLRRDMNEGTVTDLVIMARRGIKEEEQEFYPNCDYLTSKYWFGGNSSIAVMGMLQYMIHEIWDYIKGEERNGR